MNARKCSPAPFAVAGICAAFIFSVVWICAINADTSWVLGENSLSDLGVSSVAIAADLFNYGCILCGALVVIFGIGKACCEKNYNRASGCFIAAAGVFMIVVGIVNKDFGNGNTHLMAAYLAFIFLALGVILSGFGNWNDGKRVSAAITIILVLIVLGSCIHNTIQMVEAIAVACALVWMFAESAKMVLDVGKS